MVLGRTVVLFTIFLNYSFNIYADQYALLVEKQAHRLSVYRLEDYGQKTFVKSYRAITGKEKGNKVVRGDKKTPEGIYFIIQTKDKMELLKMFGSFSNKYGPKAFVLNYPNVYDAKENKTGSGIWIHGVANDDRVLNPYDTEGCVALANSDILDLAKYIVDFQTPVVIVDELKNKNIGQIFGQEPKYASWLETWRNAWESGDYLKYRLYYSDKFQTVNKNKKQWIERKEKISKLNRKNVSILVQNPKVIEFKDQLVITFDQKYSSALNSDVGRKYLYLQKEDELYKILSEEFYPVTKWN